MFVKSSLKWEDVYSNTNFMDQSPSAIIAQSVEHIPMSYWAKRLIPCSQEPVAGCTSPDESSSHPFNFLEITFIIILPSVSNLPSGLFPLGFPTKTLHAFLFSPRHVTCPVRAFCFDLIVLTTAYNSDAPCNNSQSMGKVIESSF